MNIRTRLSLQFVLIVAIILLVFSVVVYTLSSYYRYSDFVRRLEQKADISCDIVLNRVNIDSTAYYKISTSNSGLPQEVFIVYNLAGKRVFFGGKAEDFNIKDVDLLKRFKSFANWNETINNREFVGLKYHSESTEYLVVISAVDIHGRNKVSNLSLILIIGFPILISLSYLSGMVFARKALSPISEVIDRVNEISGSKLHLRLSEGNRTDELAQLSITFNNMLERLESAFNAQRAFISNASHELRTPLTVIYGQLELALMQPEKHNVLLETVEEVKSEVMELVGLVNGLLQLAKANSDENVVAFSEVRMDELILEARLDMLKAFPNAVININFLSPPENVEEIILHGNPMLLKAMLTNLINNGLVYSSVKPVEVTLKIKSEGFTISVLDNGTGINNAELKKVFDPFYRSTGSTQKDGHGLGLSIVKGIVELHKGDISIQNHTTGGLLFTIFLPRKTKYNHRFGSKYI